ncbi:hypothetical protein GIY23_21170 [Allosaccharopolyspora coralli]|uniref:Carboxypeptidase regulatory-like domain-containing protein n=1 Tax=Allosaccharopolyspora coralli TaxID=2665642 RepID=A0A5Q3QJI7_9PSEU|nr:hypothetical protein [Allosaccharopolyspora coralli]QGK71695.1 hypothetical protein GIY23_21170 [Allosaccharopolyspora coralli]
MSDAKFAELRALRAWFEQTDPAPPHRAQAAYAALDVAARPAGAGALELVGDSAEERVPTRTAARAAESRVLTFLMPGRLVELDLVPTLPGSYRASGVVVSRAGQGVTSGDVALRHPGGERAAVLDPYGAFAVEDVPRGPISVVLRPAGAEPAVAEWLVC